MDQPLEMAGLGATLAINAYRTLKALELRIAVVGDYDPLCGLNRGLRVIAGNNILEEFGLHVEFSPDIRCRAYTEDWATFDSLLTESGAFPMLHLVLVGIWFQTIFLNINELRESLKQDKFPRLVESNEVDFIFRS